MRACHGTRRFVKEEIFRSLGFLKNRRKLDEDELREMTRSLRRALQEADFNVRQTKEIVERMETRLRRA